MEKLIDRGMLYLSVVDGCKFTWYNVYEKNIGININKSAWDLLNKQTRAVENLLNKSY